ncbi:putative membrane protein [Devosia sp. H5989]|nr:putative membrane protein [Devosia sp. H5989]
MAIQDLFNRMSHAVSKATGQPITFALAVALVVVWAVSGPIFGYSETWQLVINTGTTIITFLMVFVLQSSQNRDGQALQLKLDELILAAGKAENSFIGAEKLTDEEIRQLRGLCDSQKVKADAPKPRTKARTRSKRATAN